MGSIAFWPRVISFRDPLLSEDDSERRRRRARLGLRADLGLPVRLHRRRRRRARRSTRRKSSSAAATCPSSCTQNQTGEWPVSRGVGAGRSSTRWTSLFSPADPPKLSFDAVATIAPTRGPARRSRTARRPTPSPSTCRGLEKLGTPSRQDENGGLAVGRQHRVLGAGVAVHAGAAARARRGAGQRRGRAAHRVPDRGRDDEDDRGRSPHRTATRWRSAAGDLDEAVSGMLTNGLAASDVNGEIGAVRLLPHRRLPHRRARRRGPLLQAFPVIAISAWFVALSAQRNKRTPKSLDLLRHAVVADNRVGDLRRPGQERI